MKYSLLLTLLLTSCNQTSHLIKEPSVGDCLLIENKFQVKILEILNKRSALVEDYKGRQFLVTYLFFIEPADVISCVVVDRLKKSFNKH